MDYSYIPTLRLLPSVVYIPLACPCLCVCMIARVSLNPFGNWRIPRTQMPINSTDRRRRRCGGGRYVHERCDIQFITHPYPHTISSSTDHLRRVLNRWVVCVVYNVIIIIIIIISYYHSRRRTHCC